MSIWSGIVRRLCSANSLKTLNEGKSADVRQRHVTLRRALRFDPSCCVCFGRIAPNQLGPLQNRCIGGAWRFPTHDGSLGEMDGPKRLSDPAFEPTDEDLIGRTNGGEAMSHE